MTRFVLLLLILIVLWILLERWLQRRGLGRGAAARRGPAPPARGSGRLVRCSGCGVHVPAERALQAGGGSFCSQACRQRHAAGG